MPPDAELLAATEEYLDSYGAVLDAFYLITGEIWLVDRADLESMTEGCQLIEERLNETVDAVVLLEVTIGIPDAMLVDLYLNAHVARAAALDACLKADEGLMLSELEEAERLDQLIEDRVGRWDSP